MLGLAGLAVDMLAFRPAVRWRHGSGQYIAGRWEGPAPTTLSITLADQPIGGRDLQRLPEGERSEELRTVWTRAELRSSDVAGRWEADRLTFDDGRTWRVVRVYPRAEGGYVKAVVVLTDA